ncbi:MAG: DsbC family protein [Betaproteobacteria bacterium]|nr:DsbC family protein [Betaproteobacteria bacterium]
MLKLTQIIAALTMMATAYGASASDAGDLKKLLEDKIPGLKAEVVANDPAVEQIRKSLAEKMPEIKIGTISKVPYGGMYEVVVNGINIFYTDEKGEVGFFGNMIDLKTQNNITQQKVAKLRTIDFASLPLDKAIVRVTGNGSRKLALFSDPECPFCQDLEKELKDINNLTTYIFLLPLTEIHPDAERKAELVWCASDKAKAWDDMMLNQKEPVAGNTNCKTPIKDIAELAAKLSITGTPGMVFANGQMIPGGLPREKIEKLLN